MSDPERLQSVVVQVFLAICRAYNAGSRQVRHPDIEPPDPLEFYASQSPTTDPGESNRLLEGLPGDAAGIVSVVQGVLLRYDEYERRNLGIRKRRAGRETSIATVREMLRSIGELNGRPLIEPRPAERRLVGICAHFAMLTTALLRHQGIPARARGGFETYFSATAHHDHWITEYWNANGGRWVRVDAEVGEPFQTRAGARVDGLDLSDTAFLTGADAWRLARSGVKPPDHFGIWGGEWIGGWDSVMNELILDFNALNKVESLPWHEHRLTRKGWEKLTAEELALLDEVAEVVARDDADFERVRALFKKVPELRK